MNRKQLLNEATLVVMPFATGARGRGPKRKLRLRQHVRPVIANGVADYLDGGQS